MHSVTFSMFKFPQHNSVLSVAKVLSTKNQKVPNITKCNERLHTLVVRLTPSMTVKQCGKLLFCCMKKAL